MQRKPFSSISSRFNVALALVFIALLTDVSRAGTATPSISGQDANGTQVTVNGTGHYTVVLYTNPDLEDDSRKMTLALDSYRSRPDFTLVRIVDLRGGVPPAMRSIVRVHIREEETKEKARLKKSGSSAGNAAPIIPDFNGSTLNALGWDSIYDQVHLVIYDPTGKEIKRVANVSDTKQLTKAVDSVL